MSLEQIERLDRIVVCAQEIRERLSHLPALENGLVHLRPTDRGITMVGLLSHRPQRGKGGYKVDKLLRAFDVEFSKYCDKVSHGRPTPEKELQSFLISSAYKHNRTLTMLNPTEQEEDIVFITDELPLHTDTGKVVCDILAFQGNQDNGKPILIELKSAREMQRLVEQLSGYTSAMKLFYPQFEQLYSTVLGRDIRFNNSPEKWLVWPALGDRLETDRREPELNRQGIRVVQYRGDSTKGYHFHVGRPCVEN